MALAPDNNAPTEIVEPSAEAFRPRGAFFPLLVLRLLDVGTLHV